MSVYCEHLCNMIRKGVKSDDYERPLKGLKIVVDAGNGVGGFYAERYSPPSERTQPAAAIWSRTVCSRIISRIPK